MKYYDDEYGYVDELDLKKIKEIRQKERIEQNKIKIEDKKKRNKTYLKGQRGVRKYYDYDKLEELGFNELTNKEQDRPIKCIYNKNLRREKLFAYLKYLKGKKISVRDLAWKFAVTERTIQSDLKFFVDNGFIERKVNKTHIGRMTKNSYIVNKNKEKDLELNDQFLFVVFITKKDDKYYILTKTDYDESNKTFYQQKIEDFEFELPNIKIENSKKIDKISFAIAKDIFSRDLKDEYKSIVNSNIIKGKFKEIDEYGKTQNEWWKEKDYFSLFVLNEMVKCNSGYKWITLNVAPRRIRSHNQNKGLKYIKDNILG